VHHEKPRDWCAILVADRRSHRHLDQLLGVGQPGHAVQEVDLARVVVAVDEHHRSGVRRVHVIERHEPRRAAESARAFADGILGTHEVDVLARERSVACELRRSVLVANDPEVHRLPADEHDRVLDPASFLSTSAVCS
jgi:hypothetical protein